MSDQIRLSVLGAAEDVKALEDLSIWLRGEPELVGRVTLHRPAPRQGEMGTLTDAVVVAVGAQGAATALAASLRAWLAQPRRADLKLTIATGEETFVEVDASNVRSSDLDLLLTRACDAAAELRAEEHTT
ncbi:MAG: hypothetical protein HOW97_27385 [Catenulispora sp.]|nr:hypothetical protein [Catenulispora sp.]